jgi:hypothetical protein
LFSALACVFLDVKQKLVIKYCYFLAAAQPFYLCHPVTERDPLDKDLPAFIESYLQERRFFQNDRKKRFIAAFAGG